MKRVLDEEYNINTNVSLGDEVSNLLSEYENVSLEAGDFNHLIHGVYDLLFNSSEYTLRELFNYYNPWDVRFLVKQGFLDGKLLTQEECKSMHAVYFLNSEEVIKKRNEVLQGEEYEESCRERVKKRWSADDVKWREWRKKALEGLEKCRDDPEISEKRYERLIKAMSSSDYVCKLLEGKGAREYREFLVQTVKSEKGQKLKSNKLELFHYFLQRVHDEGKGWEFITPKMSKKDGGDEARFLKSCVKGNFLYLNHVLSNFDKSEVLKNAGEYLKENSVDLSVFPETYDGFKNLVEVFGIERSRGYYYRFKSFHADYFPYLAACKLKNNGFNEGDLMREARSILHLSLCTTSSTSRGRSEFINYYNKFTHAYKELENNGWISECSG